MDERILSNNQHLELEYGVCGQRSCNSLFSWVLFTPFLLTGPHTYLFGVQIAAFA